MVIIGLGHVGSQVLTEAVRAGIFAEIVTIDKKEGVAFGEALDHHQASALPGNPGVKLRSGDYGTARTRMSSSVLRDRQWFPTGRVRSRTARS